MPKILSTSLVDPALGIHTADGGKYFFYHLDSFPNAPPQIYQDLIGRAVSEVSIWDPYFNIGGTNRDQDIFTSIGNNITIRILTQKALSSTSDYFTKIADELKLVIPPSKNARLAMRAINKNEIRQQNWRFHDRFLILDQSEVFIVGASLGWHTQVNHSTGVYRVTDNDTAVFIRSMFDDYWATASDFPYILRYLH